GLVVLKAADEQRADVLFEYVADRMRLPYFVWRDGIGLCRVAPGMRPMLGTGTLLGCLKHIASRDIDALYQLKLDEASFAASALVARIKDISERFMKSPAAILLCAAEPVLPGALLPLATFIELAEPTREEYYDYMRALVKDVARRVPLSVALSSEE